MNANLKFDFKNENSYIFEKKILYTTQKDTMLHVTITFSLTRRQTRASNGPITLPLKYP